MSTLTKKRMGFALAALVVLGLAAALWFVLVRSGGLVSARGFLTDYYTVGEADAASAAPKTDEELAALLALFEGYATGELLEALAQNRLAGAPAQAAAQAGCRLLVSELDLEKMGETENRVQYRYAAEVQAIYAGGVSKACLFTGELETEKAGGERRVCSFAPEARGAEEMAAILA